MKKRIDTLLRPLYFLLAIGLLGCQGGDDKASDSDKSKVAV